MEAKKYFGNLSNSFAYDYGSFLKLIPTCEQYDREDIKLIYKALHKAKEAHASQIRKSGEPYINHPISVAALLAKNGFNAMIVVGALLHDTNEDTFYKVDMCKEDFGDEIANLVESVTKIGRDTNEETRDKILERTEKNFGTIIIKSGDRLHNICTLDFMKPQKQIEIATETKGFYVPVNRILRMNKIKRAFEDICSFYLDKENFITTYDILEELMYDKKDTLNRFGEEVQDKLSKQGIGMKFTYSNKNIGSICEEINKDNSFDLKSKKDLLKVNMVLKSRLDCYDTLEIIRKMPNVNISSYKDYISVPMKSGYQSIDVRLNLENTPILINIETEQMNKCNNFGIFYSDSEEEKEYAKIRLREFRNNLKLN